LLPAVVGEGAVGLGHLVRVFLFLDRRSLVAAGCLRLELVLSPAGGLWRQAIRGVR
jgi:hypothetical protein